MEDPLISMCCSHEGLSGLPPRLRGARSSGHHPSRQDIPEETERCPPLAAPTATTQPCRRAGEQLELKFWPNTSCSSHYLLLEGLPLMRESLIDEI